ncbi:MAG: hypothetical protein ACJAWW_001485 [Sulfurimonas sp.]|jgi:hypothetical protein
MKRFLTTSLVATLAISTSAFAQEVKTANSIKDMFSNGTVSAQVRLGYISNNAAATKDTTAGAIGGQLKFESTAFKGLSFGTAMYTSQSISAISGDANDGEYNNEMASDYEAYTELAEAYLNYTYKGFIFRAGRQLIDTPLANSDDIRMTPHTFEAYIASYSFEDLGLSFIAGNILNWQGVDADYENVTNDRWAETGVDGTRLVAATYTNDFIEAGAWYYDVTDNATAAYGDVTGTIAINDDITVLVAVQILSESEQENSTIAGSIVGAMLEAGFYGVTASLAYDQVSVDDGDQIFEGFGGGSSYTNMDTMTAGSLHDGTYGDGSSFVAGIAYKISNVNIFAAYGDFQAEDIGSGKAHVTETDLGVEYSYNDGEADIALYYVMGEDKESSSNTDFDDSHVQLTLNYNF